MLYPRATPQVLREFVGRVAFVCTSTGEGSMNRPAFSPQVGFKEPATVDVWSVGRSVGHVRIY